MIRRRRHTGFALLATLLLMVLLIAIGAQLATTTASAAVLARRRHNSQAHELAVDSTIILLGRRLETVEGRANTLHEALDRDGVAVLEFEIGGVDVRCRLADDAAKINPLLFQRDDQRHLLTRKLSRLMSSKALPRARVRLRPVLEQATGETPRRYRWFDQLLDGVQPGMLFRWAETNHSVWSDAVTFWGDGRMDLRRASPQVLDVFLEDIRPGLGQRILSKRRQVTGEDFLQQALADVDAEVRARVAARLGYDLQRYAVHIETAIDGDRRRWYVVVQMTGTGLSVLHRSPITW